MAAKHTAGEWHAKDGQIYPIETGKTLATIPYFDKDNEERSANAKLIAAAPEMLRILKELQQAFIHVEGDTKGNKTRTDIFKNCPEFRKLAADTRNAIEKATT